MKTATRLALAPFALALACAVPALVQAPDDLTVPAVSDPIDLLADGLDEWVVFSRAGYLERGQTADVLDGILRVSGDPVGAVTTRRWYRDYVLEFDWRWAGEPGNSGLLVHAQAPLVWNGWPRCVEVQLRSGDAGDFILMGDQVGLRPNGEPDAIAPASPSNPDIRRRVENLVDGLERAPGEWNTMRVECDGATLRVFVNGTLANVGRDLTIREGAIAFQSEGAPIEFRNTRLEPLAER